LLQVKTQVAIAIADQYGLEKKHQENEEKTAEWVRKAEMAVHKEAGRPGPCGAGALGVQYCTEFVTNVTSTVTNSYTPYKPALQTHPNLEIEESRNNMKKTWLRFAAATAVAGGMLLAAQEVGSQPAQPAVQQHRQQRPHDGGARIARYLNLTPAQEARANAEFQSARQSGQPIRQQLKQVRSAMFQAVRANDTAGIERLSAQQAGLRGRILAVREEAFARVYSTLTPEQRAKADTLPAHFRQMRQRRTESHQNPSNG
jgi:Spy/CpxP family protein refolding chaperone